MAAREVAQQGAMPAPGARPYTAAKTRSNLRSTSPSFGSRSGQRPRIYRWRTMPHTVMTAKSQHSSSHHLPMIRSTAYCQLRIGIRSVSSLGEKSQPGVVEPAGGLGRGQAGWRLLRAEPRAVAGSPASRRFRPSPRHTTRSRPSWLRSRTARAGPLRDRARPANRGTGRRARSARSQTERGSPRAAPGSRARRPALTPARISNRPGAGRSLPATSARNVHMSPRLSLSVSWPSSAARGNRTASAAARQAIRRSKSARVRP